MLSYSAPTIHKLEIMADNYIEPEGPDATHTIECNYVERHVPEGDQEDFSALSCMQAKIFLPGLSKEYKKVLSASLLVAAR